MTDHLQAPRLYEVHNTLTDTLLLVDTFFGAALFSTLSSGNTAATCGYTALVLFILSLIIAFGSKVIVQYVPSAGTPVRFLPNEDDRSTQLPCLHWLCNCVLGPATLLILASIIMFLGISVMMECVVCEILNAVSKQTCHVVSGLCILLPVGCMVLAAIGSQQYWTRQSPLPPRNRFAPQTPERIPLMTERGEDLGMSQFWCPDECADQMARIITGAALSRLPTAAADAKVRIACISAPSAYKALKRLADSHVLPFDFNSPSTIQSILGHEELGGALTSSFDGIIADLPDLNEDSMRKMSEMIQLLVKSSLLSSTPTPLMLNTGAILTEPIARTFKAKPCKKQPRHRVTIMNPFTSFTNFECQELEGWEGEEEKEEEKEEKKEEKKSKSSCIC